MFYMMQGVVKMEKRAKRKAKRSLVFVDAGKWKNDFTSASVFMVFFFAKVSLLCRCMFLVMLGLVGAVKSTLWLLLRRDHCQITFPTLYGLDSHLIIAATMVTSVHQLWVMIAFSIPAASLARDSISKIALEWPHCTTQVAARISWSPLTAPFFHLLICWLTLCVKWEQRADSRERERERAELELTGGKRRTEANNNHMTEMLQIVQRCCSSLKWHCCWKVSDSSRPAELLWLLFSWPLHASLWRLH